jgi:hypothetical protein
MSEVTFRRKVPPLSSRKRKRERIIVLKPIFYFLRPSLKQVLQPTVSTKYSIGSGRGSQAHAHMVCPLVREPRPKASRLSDLNRKSGAATCKSQHAREVAGRDKIKGRPSYEFLLKQIVLDLTGRGSGFEPVVGLSISSPPPASDCCQEMTGK